MYNPIQPGIPHVLRSEAIYQEVIPSAELVNVVYCFWALSTKSKLEEDFEYLVVPDGCIDIIFDVGEKPEFDGALIMTPDTTAERLNLGRSFSYVGIRLLPGTWHDSPHAIIGDSTFVNSLGGQDLRHVRQRLVDTLPYERINILEQLVYKLEKVGVIGVNYPTLTLLEQADSLKSVEDISVRLGYSTRHARRLIQQQVGYNPHDFLKVVRFQQALARWQFDAFADQSHFIRECKRITGMTPSAFQSAYL